MCFSLVSCAGDRPLLTKELLVETNNDAPPALNSAQTPVESAPAVRGGRNDANNEQNQNNSSSGDQTSAESGGDRGVFDPNAEGSAIASSHNFGIDNAVANSSPLQLGYIELNVYPHDSDVWTQGLEIATENTFFESAGLAPWSSPPGSSSIRIVDRTTGVVRVGSPLPNPDHFAEGITVVGQELYQITWKDGTAYRWSTHGLEPLSQLSYNGQGWGLCYNGSNLVMSDGTANLKFIDPDGFLVVGIVEVRLRGEPMMLVNELECVDNQIWANVLGDDRIYRIDPGTGVVTAIVDLSDLGQPRGPRANVLNGIAYDPVDETFWVTGKFWSTMHQIKIVELEY